MSTLYERLLEICRDQGIDNPRGRDIQALTGLSSGRITQIKQGGEAARLGGEPIQRLNRLGYLADWIQEGRGTKQVAGHRGVVDMATSGGKTGSYQSFADQPEGSAETVVSTEAYAPRPPTEVPVVGTTQGGPPDRIWHELSFPVGYSDEYLEVSTPDPHAYALRVVGSSMAPRIMEGEWLLVEPSGEAQAGDDVIVKTTGGAVMVKTLLSVHGGTVILASVNEAFERISLDRREIEFMHFVAGRFASRYVKRRIGDSLAAAQQPMRRIAQRDYEGDERRSANTRQPYNLANAPRFDETGRRINPPPGDRRRKTGGAQ